MDLRVGSFEYLLGISDQRVEGRGDDLFRRYRINEQQQPSPQRFDGGMVSAKRCSAAASLSISVR